MRSRNVVPTPAQLKHLPGLLKKQERAPFFAASAGFVISLIFLLVWGYVSHLILLPSAGGSYTEGLIGAPQFVNPLYASANDVDQDLSRLVYSGLMKWDPSAGLIPDLAASYTVSQDERVYTFSLRDDASWHDGSRVTPRDVIFTFNAMQNSEYRSPLASTFRGVAVEQVDERTVALTLEEPFAPFLSTLTVGILPADYWGDIDPTNVRLAERNLIPIGSGPYTFDELEKNKQGVIQSYTLRRYPKYYGGEPLVETLTFKFYGDATSALAALRDKKVEGIAFLSSDQIETAEKQSGTTVVTPRLPQLTALFFNLDRDAVADVRLREALASAIDKEALVNEVLLGRGAVAHSPIIDSYTTDSDVYANPHPYNLEEANRLLGLLGWSKADGETFFTKTVDGEQVTLNLRITTVDQPETVLVAEAIADMWQAAGVDANVDVIDAADIRDDILKNREYDILLSGILMGADPDPYPFWHSSQQDHPCLNLAQYANRNADNLIEEARSTGHIAARKERYEGLTEMIHEDTPAIFLYQPTYAYATSERLRGVNIGSIVIPSDRFGQIHEWYIRTKKMFRWNVES